MFSKTLAKIKLPRLERFIDLFLPKDDSLENEVIKAIGRVHRETADDQGAKVSLRSQIDEIAQEVKEVGYFLIPCALSEHYINALRTEFDQIIAAAGESPYVVDKHDGAVCVRVSPRYSLNSRKYPVTAAFFNLGIFRKLSLAFYGPGSSSKLLLNREVFVHETPETNAPLSMKLHWDRAQTLKFWVYVDDIPLEAGPMRVKERSSQVNRLMRQGIHRKPTDLIGGKDNLTDQDQEAENIRALSGKAGTILIHDTDASHGASEVQPGFMRRIMRGHTRLCD